MRDFWSLSWKVAMRHWAVYRKNFLANILPTVVDPGFFLLVFGVWMGSHIADMHGMSYVRYLAPGMVLTTCLFTAFFESSYGFFVRNEFQGVYHAMMTTPIGPKEILTGEFIWVALKGAVMATGVAAVLSVAGVVSARYIFFIPILGALVGVGCGAIGLVAAAKVRNIDQFQTVYALVISPMFFISGIFFPIDQLPRWIRILCNVSPFYHGVRVGQLTLWGGEIETVWIAHVAALTGLSIVLALWAIRSVYPKLYR